MEKKVYKIFPGSERKNVKKFLEKMFLDGYKLINIKRNTYYFEKVEPKNVTYEFDFQILKKEEENEYLSYETEWNFTANRGGNYWFYIEKDIDGNHIPFFNNNESKILFLSRHLRLYIVITSFMVINSIVLLLNPYKIFNYFGYYSLLITLWFGYTALKYLSRLIKVKNDILE